MSSDRKGNYSAEWLADRTANAVKQMVPEVCSAMTIRTTSGLDNAILFQTDDGVSYLMTVMRFEA